MKLLLLITLLLASLPEPTQAQSPAGHLRLQPVPERARFTDPGYFVWCGSMTKAATIT